MPLLPLCSGTCFNLSLPEGSSSHQDALRINICYKKNSLQREKDLKQRKSNISFYCSQNSRVFPGELYQHQW
ncbi:hypothetical protein XENTR_v10005350 [Xenopus tropicalis]|nr:hypothetical protein XENTR_v10005350 [Xenopus tropicalis]